MSEQSKQITREELYAEVWRTPISKLALSWGISAARIVKACEEMDVPRPESGHWSMAQRGWKVDQSPLPPLEAKVPASTVLKPSQKRPKPQPELMAVTENKSNVKMASDFSQVHPEVRKMKRMLESGYKDATGLLHGMRNQRVLRVKVSKTQSDRALQIVDTLIKKLEDRGAKFVTVENSELRELRIDNERIECLLIEETTRKERSSNDKDTPAWRFNRWAWQATGRLRFQIEEYEPEGGQKKWSDSKYHSLEGQIDEIVERLFETAVALKKWAIAREEQSRRWEEERRQREEVERRKALELQHRNTLEQQAQQWVRAANLRAFIQACEERMRGGSAGVTGDCWETKWLAWAKQHAERMNPLTNGFLEDQKRKRPELVILS